MIQICSIELCERPAYAKGWCCAHYQRWQRHGDPLAGRTMEGEPARFLRRAIPAHQSDDCLLWPFNKTKKGYATISVNGVPCRVTRIVCDRVRGPAPSPMHEAAHSCGNSQCVNERHLRWATPKSNQADRWKHGTEPRGEKNSCAKLSEDDVRSIRTMLPSKSHTEIADAFGVTSNAIRLIEIGRNWGWLDGAFPDAKAGLL